MPYIPPNYTDLNNEDEAEEIIPIDIDEGKEESNLDLILGSQQKNMTPPFINQQPQPKWGEPPQQNPWQRVTTPWGNAQPTQQNNQWRSSGSGWTGGSSFQQPRELNREKKVIFIDFLDCIVETIQSNQVPGYLPRDIYDLTPKFNVWQKLAALNPKKVYILIPRNLLPTTNGAQGWEATLTYYCCSLSSFLRIPYTGCQVLVQSVIGQPKADIMLSVIDDPKKPINREDILCIGIYSGINGQSDIDKLAAENCKIDYLDLTSLLQMV